MNKLQKGIPIPNKRYGLTSKYPFDNMEVGDSFVASKHSILSVARNWARINKKDYKFTTRKIAENKIRIWRIK